MPGIMEPTVTKKAFKDKAHTPLSSSPTTLHPMKSKDDSEPAKKHHVEKGKDSKEPVSPTCLKEPLSPLTVGLLSPLLLIIKKILGIFQISSRALAIHNICNVGGKFKVPKHFPCYFPIMPAKGSPGLVGDN
ncbi:hypothetical protein DSO57_1018984 [Entomophthora muscae]|uniref:Uncharacterized protein n=1 Tax=Entomophthora muscae TaxID=34485 RepID=A0ACC2UQT6_9FUNG|nr:hypothetical protein DSO57_1018984 [Entomophthora muscae]